MKENDQYSTRETLLERIRNKHDDKSWEDFVYFYRNYIYIICRRMNLAHHDAEEVVQKILIKMWKKLPDFQYDKSKSFRKWLCIVSSNCVRDYFRDIKRQSDKIDKAANERGHSEIGAPEIEAIAEKEWENYIVNMALNNIRDKFSEKVINIFVELSEGATAKTLAEKMSIPANTISVYKKRVSAKLCEEIRRLNIELS
ncbi:MAG: RNA polymerase sigma factor [Lentisphaeraceae bacterium]|nr:RNA polymerase sigma factor [Lentisphaeraceae bacterium]